jgi:chromosomal replication initiation ATPase DnaA
VSTLIVRQVVRDVANYHCVGVKEILARHSRQEVRRARHEVIRRLHQRGWSACKIGMLLGRDHSTVLASLERSAA